MLVLSQTYRMAPSVTLANAATLEQAEYRIRTEVGLANTGHRHTSEFPTEQGSANSPAAIWCFLSSSSFDCYEKTPYQAGYTDPSQGQTVNVGIIGIVDDCHGQTNQFTLDGSAHTVASLLIQAQHNTQLWNNLLAVSGGALELSKHLAMCSNGNLQQMVLPFWHPTRCPTCRHSLSRTQSQQ